MFDDLEDGSHLGLWAAAGLLVLLLLGLAGGLWLQQHRATQAMTRADKPALFGATTPAARVESTVALPLR